MSEFVTVATLDDLPRGACRTVEAHGIWIALFNVDGTIFALDNTCPHAGGPLGEGKLCNDIVECPWHGWRFNVRTGERVENSDFKVPRCEVRLDGKNITVAVPFTP
ncbi:MAG: Rieske (2Fe-2S) protein [Nitrospiraceae bacterium]